MKVLISSCVLGGNVRWNGANKLNQQIIEWAAANDIDLVPVCPENELLGTPRPPIKLVQVEEKICALLKDRDIIKSLDKKCKEILYRHPDAKGFIGIANSPTCGISVGVKNLGKVTKGIMHKQCNFPTTESNALNRESNQEIYIRRLAENNQ